MFALFFSLYYSMFTGIWRRFDLFDIRNATEGGISAIGTILTSMFNNVETPFTTLGERLVAVNDYGYQPLLCLVTLVLALITSIGIVVMAVKGIKRVFGVFFMGIR